MRCLLAVFALALAAGAPAAAGADDEPSLIAPGADSIPAEEWRRMVRGRTVTYRIGADVWAYERYAPQGDSVWIQMADGTCMTGTWFFVDDSYCFNWLPELSSCFRHLRAGKEIFIVPVENGEIAGAVQTVASISDLALTCGPTLSS